MSTVEKNHNAALLALRDQLALVRHSDRARLARDLDRLFSRKTAGPELERSIDALKQSIEESARKVARLRELPLRIAYDASLPITAHRQEIIEGLAKHQVLIVCGATGSGKTTQLPKMCLEAGRGAFGLIGHTQPRRIAARALANRLAEELAAQVGSAVGYQVRFNDRTGPDTRVKLMTDGILLRELEQDRLLRRYDTLIIDEAHERSLNIDFLLGVLQRLLPQRPDLRVIITSATIDPQRFASFFGGAPIIEVSGRSYPVEVRYRPLLGDDEDGELTLSEGIVAAVRELDHAERGDALVFLPGEKQIRDAADALSKAKLHNTEILPLYSRLSTSDQERIFQKHGARRIVLATNVAETSLTVPGIRYVIDSGLARISRYSVRGKVQRLPIEPIAQASADQRKGRCGRESAGICIRLYAEDEFTTRPEFTSPEILRTNLASVILQMASLDLGSPEDFPFVDPPDTRQINDGYRLLQELKAVDDSRKVTSLGKQIAAVPTDPRLARMLLSAGHHSCLAEMLVLTGFLASQDPRERPSDAQTQADQKHATYADPRSDFVTVLKLWKMYGEQSEALSGGQLRRWCRENFLSYLRLREWQELHRQLSEVVADFELRLNTTPASYDELHQAILTGFLGGIGALDEKREYEGARGSRFVIAPGTPLASKPPKWVVAASLLETTRLYARMVAAIEPLWIESAGAHLLKRSYSEPHWVEDRGFVAAFESTALYGLTLSVRRRVNYGAVAPREALEIFAREALVLGHTGFKAQFLERNRELRSEVEALEAKLRRRDVFVDEQAMVDFYRSRLPEQVNTIATLQKWLKGDEHAKDNHVTPDQVLTMSRADLMRREVAEINDDSHPDALSVGANQLPLEYRFEPASPRDGLTLTVPLPLLEALQANELSWAIPGWRLEKITAVLRGLPKAVRKSFVPVPDYASRALSELRHTPDFHAAMAEWITREAGVTVTPEEVAATAVPDHLRFNIRIVGLDGKVIAEGRDLVTVKRAARSQSSRSETAAADVATHRSWDFGTVPVEREVQRRGLHFTVFPTLRDCGDGVQLSDVPRASEADALLRSAVLRLVILAMPEQWKYARKRFADERDLILLAQGITVAKTLPERLAEKCFDECFFRGLGVLPRSAIEFQALLDQRRGSFGETVDRVGAHALDTLRELRAVRLKLGGLQGPAFAALNDQVHAQLARLVPETFPAGVHEALWPHLPRYMKALNRRLEKVAGNIKRDAELASKITAFGQAAEKLAKAPVAAALRPEFNQLQWMIEELRVSIFAQDLRTAIPVSEKRVADQVEKAKLEAERVA